MGIIRRWKKFNYKLEIEIFRNSTQNILGVLRVLFKGLGVQKGTQTPCWLRPCLENSFSFECALIVNHMFKTTFFKFWSNSPPTNCTFISLKNLYLRTASVTMIHFDGVPLTNTLGISEGWLQDQIHPLCPISPYQFFDLLGLPIHAKPMSQYLAYISLNNTTRWLRNVPI